jgi:TetR/AcrR family transcriptional regulator, copper-responsive repressor
LSTAATEAVGDRDVRARLRDGLQEFDRAFEARLKHAQKLGELAATADTAILARIASAFQHTIALRSRAGDSLASLRATARAGVQMICGNASAASAMAKPTGRTKQRSNRKS